MASPQSSKLHGRAFYESIGSPKLILAPMVDRSEFAWRLLSRSYLGKERSTSLLAYTPMFHGRMFGEQASVRDEHFQPTRGSLKSKDKSDEPPHLDGNPALDRPLFVQFCANKPDELLQAAEYVAPYCDAVDLNLGCPQGIAKSGHYGAFLQEDWDTIHALIGKLHRELLIPVTAKMRILETRKKTLEYAKVILSAGASILTVHGRRREQKGHNTGVADWSMIRYLRDNLPPETVLFANGNILNSRDIESCLAATGADGIMSAEGNLSDPTIFALPPSNTESREYWHESDGTGGYRIDGVFRRYMDIIYQHILDQGPPQRPPLYMPGDPNVTDYFAQAYTTDPQDPRKRKRANPYAKSPNLRGMQGHLFHLLKHMLSHQIHIRDALAKATIGDMPAFEKVLRMLEIAVKQALDEDAATQSSGHVHHVRDYKSYDSMTPSERTMAKYKRPWWVCQPNIRTLPEEALKKGAMQPSKKELRRIKQESMADGIDDMVRRDDGRQSSDKENEIPKEALFCG